MALSIGVHQGSRITVGNHCVEVKALASPNLIIVSVDGGPDIVVSDQSSTKLLPEVYAFSGVGKNGGSNRLAFRAPKNIKIFREELC